MNNKEEKSKECYECGNWQYNERTERIYGQGTGVCELDKQPKGCNRKSCMLFKDRE